MRDLAPWLCAALAALTVGCAGLSPPEGRTETIAIAGTDATRLGRAVAPLAAAHPGKSGIHALNAPRDAFAARGLLAAAADRSLDVQYYIWHGDRTGYLLFEALWLAAERGVRVRLLLDDNNTAGLDPTIAALDAHPHIEVRLYNPVAHRGLRMLNFVTDFARVNRRMHNKSLTADNQASIVGGRNVGDEYYGAGSGVVFEDLDVLAVGPIVRDVSASFDRYWNSASAYPAAAFVGTGTPQDRAALEARFAATRADPASVAYLDALRRSPVTRQLLEGNLQLEWANARLVDDDPAKTLDTAPRRETLLLADLLPVIGVPKRSFDLVSPYFVPGAEGAEALAALARGGVQVRVLTNSLAATDVLPVHAGYAKRRERLLRAGVRLFELRPTLERAESGEKSGFGGSSSASLHAKTFAVDGARIFVGSFNFDPRSALLNTEMGVVIDSPTLAGRLATAFETEAPRIAYELRLAPDGGLRWIERTASGEIVHTTEPGTSAFSRGAVGVLSILPIEWLL
jgi:putative cardiolipin synthase